MIFGLSAKNWLKIRYYMLDFEKSADQCNFSLNSLCCLYVLVMPRTRFRVNRHSLVA